MQPDIVQDVLGHISDVFDRDPRSRSVTGVIRSHAHHPSLGGVLFHYAVDNGFGLSR